VIDFRAHGPTILVTPFFLNAYNVALWIGYFMLARYTVRWSKRIAKAWTDQPRMALPTTLDVEETELTFKDDDVTQQYYWRAFSKFVETENLFLLYPSERMFFMIPRRAFTSDDDAMIFLGQLTTNIGNGWLLHKPPTGFSVIPFAALAGPAIQEEPHSAASA
jgi:hypothetical protein